MYLFARTARLGPGNPVEQMTWAATITEKVNQISELDVTLWTSVFSPGLGTLAWTAAVEDLAALVDSDEKLMVDSGYLSLVEEGTKFSSGQAIDDGLLQLLHADQDAATIQAQYASVVQSVIAPGQTARAIEFGVEIAQAAKKVTGCPTSFGIAATGPYGGVEWITVYESIAQMQKAQEDMAADASFGERVDRDAGTLFLSGVTTQTAYRKIA